MTVTTIGIDLAKSVFQVHGVDSRGRAVLRKQLRRIQLQPFFANLSPCLIGMESCCGSHYFARQLEALGHTVKLIAPQLVKPYVKSNKNDANDAEAICEAVSRPNMRFVHAKNLEQQAVLMMHRVRQGFVAQRTAQVNQIRGLLMEFGVIYPKGIAANNKIPELLDNAKNGIPDRARQLFWRLYEYLLELNTQIKSVDGQIKAWHRESPESQRLQRIPGIGPLTASAIVASVGNARVFKTGRQMAAWLGLVPRQFSSGGKQVLRGISKRGDVYIRKLLVLGAHAVIRHQRVTAPSGSTGWLQRLLTRRSIHVAAVALANKNARIAWALLAKDREYRPGYNRCEAAAI
jgi:transposase